MPDLSQHLEALREQVSDWPDAPGVYTFHGDSGDLPLYIGKSVNLRTRVLAHLRNAEETRMLIQTRRLSYTRTAGEIGALLLEAQRIKQQHPVFNQRLRRNRQLCAWQLHGHTLRLVHAREVDFATTPDLYGLYASAHAAKEALRELADAHRLCLQTLGLERGTGTRGCFRAMLRHCSGVCRGDEPPEAHRARLLDALAALRISVWPYEGAVGLVERWHDARTGVTDVQVHAVNNWHYLGSAQTPEQARQFTRVAAGFDADGYKILVRSLLTGTVECLPLIRQPNI